MYLSLSLSPSSLLRHQRKQCGTHPPSDSPEDGIPVVVGQEGAVDRTFARAQVERQRGWRLLLGGVSGDLGEGGRLTGGIQAAAVSFGAFVR